MLEPILTRQLCSGKGWRVDEVTFDYRTEQWVARLRPTRKSAVCSGCGETKREHLDIKNQARCWRHLDGWGVHTMVIAPLRRVRCRWCGIRVEQVPWARPRARMTLAFETKLISWVKSASIQAVSRQHGVHWTTVMRLVEQHIQEAADRRFRRKLRRIGVDEVSYGKGQKKYLTIVWDHDRAQIVWMGKGREEDTLDQFFAKLGRRRAARLEVVTMDMAKGYIASVTKHASLAEVVFDRFHIERHLTEAVNEVRKAEFWRRGGAHRKAIRGKKYLLLKKRRRLHWRRRRDLDELFKLNRRLQVAYLLKEQFEVVWHYRTRYGMEQALERWRRMLRWQRLEPLKRFWAMIERHMTGVLGWASTHITNAALEGNNSWVRGVSTRARGYRNVDNLMTMLFHCGCG
jgi:transposase